MAVWRGWGEARSIKTTSGGDVGLGLGFQIPPLSVVVSEIRGWGKEKAPVSEQREGIRIWKRGREIEQN